MKNGIVFAVVFIMTVVSCSRMKVATKFSERYQFIKGIDIDSNSDGIYDQTGSYYDDANTAVVGDLIVIYDKLEPGWTEMYYRTEDDLTYRIFYLEPGRKPQEIPYLYMGGQRIWQN